MPLTNRPSALAGRVTLGVLLLLACIQAPLASEQSLQAMRKAFLQAEHYIKQNRDADYLAVADSLKTYPLYPYLHYQWLKNHLDDDNAVQSFVHEHAYSRYASLLQRLWLVNLGETRQWRLLLRHYRPGEDSETQCYYGQALYHEGESDAANKLAQKLWLSGKPQANACEALFTLFKAQTIFNPDLVWRRFQAALTNNNDRLAAQTATLLPEPDRDNADTWLKLHQQPQLIGQTGAWNPAVVRSGELFAHAVVRWLDLDPAAALAVWDTRKRDLNIPTEIAADTEKRLALALAFKRDPRAASRLAQLPTNDTSTREWRIRAALALQNWPEASAGLAALTDEEKASDRWQYWLARTLAATGQGAAADAIFRQLAEQRSFYGFLAADRSKRDIAQIDRPVAVSNDDIQSLQQETEFLVAAELLAIDRKAEAKRQWWHAVSGADQRRLVVAAKLAQQWQWPAMAIFTIAKANNWDDMTLRFPLQYQAQIQSVAERLQLDPSLIFGLIRQESAFDEFAESSAGAKGLMQLLPSTAQQLARERKQIWRDDSALFEPATNIDYGGQYYKKLLTRFGGHYLLATAAYNAGPERVKRWLPAESVPGDIWIETIPYKETRNYVSSVVLYTLIYQQRLQANKLKVSDLMREIAGGKN